MKFCFFALFSVSTDGNGDVIPPYNTEAAGTATDSNGNVYTTDNDNDTSFLRSNLQSSNVKMQLNSFVALLCSG